MLLKNPRQSTGDVPGLWGSRLAAPIVLGALLVMPPIAYATSNATTAPAAPPPTWQSAGCTEVSPGPANLLAAMEGQPPIPGQGRWTCR